MGDMAYTAATASDLTMRFPEFASVDTDRIDYWLDDALTRYVLANEWADPDGKVAQILVASHNMALEGFGDTDSNDIPVGVTQMRSGALSLSFDGEYVRHKAAGGWSATKYGAQYLALLKSARGGSRVTMLGRAPVCGAGWRSSLLGGYDG